MDNNNYLGAAAIPSAISILFNDSIAAGNFFNNLDSATQEDIISKEHDFQSREELQRYIDHLNEETLR